jgi:hypothetical protein
LYKKKIMNVYYLLLILLVVNKNNNIKCQNYQCLYFFLIQTVSKVWEKVISITLLTKKIFVEMKLEVKRDQANIFYGNIKTFDEKWKIDKELIWRS